MEGNVYLELSEVLDMNRLQLEHPGVYIAIAHKVDGSVTTKKLVVLE